MYMRHIVGVLFSLLLFNALMFLNTRRVADSLYNPINELAVVVLSWNRNCYSRTPCLNINRVGLTIRGPIPT